MQKNSLQYLVDKYGQTDSRTKYSHVRKYFFSRAKKNIFMEADLFLPSNFEAYSLFIFQTFCEKMMNLDVCCRTTGCGYTAVLP